MEKGINNIHIKSFENYDELLISHKPFLWTKLRYIYCPLVKNHLCRSKVIYAIFQLVMLPLGIQFLSVELHKLYYPTQLEII